MNKALLQCLQSSLKKRELSGLYRQRVNPIQNSDFLNFSCNDYLSLATDLRLKQIYQNAYEHYPVCSGGSPVVSGYHHTHQDLEEAFSKALGVDDALFFSSGFVANLSLMQLFSQLKVKLYIDKAIHASVYDGIAASQISFKRYKHCDVDDLKRKSTVGDSAVIMTESIFSMSGQEAPLVELIQLSAEYVFDVCVDEAHAFGVMGNEGLGLVNALHLTQHEVPLRVIPLGKAFAGSGAIVAGHKDWIAGLLQYARPYIYSTAPSPALAYGLMKTLDIVRAADERRTKLKALIAYFCEAKKQSAWSWRDSTSPIQQLQLGCPHEARMLSEQLLQQSIICYPIRQPTVSKQETGLRVILNYRHQPEDIDYLFRCLQ